MSTFRGVINSNKPTVFKNDVVIRGAKLFVNGVEITTGGGNVVGPGGSTVTAIAKYANTSGELLENTDVLIDASNNITGVGTLTATTVIANLTGDVNGATLTVLGGGANFLADDGTYKTVGTGDVVGPGSSTATAIAKYADTNGDLLLNTGVLIDASNNITGVGTLSATTVTANLTGDVNGVTLTNAGLASDKLGADGNYIAVTKEEVTGLKLADIPNFADVIIGGNSIGNNLAILNITGVVSGTVVSVNAGDNTTFDVAAGTYFVLDPFTDPMNPTFTPVTLAGQVGIAMTGTAPFTYVYADINGDIQQQTSEWTAEQVRDNAILAIVVRENGVNISAVSENQIFARGAAYLAVDQARAIGGVNIAGNHFTPNGANLQIDRSSGETFGLSINAAASQKTPNNIIRSGDTALTFDIIYSNGAGGFTEITGQTNMNVTQYDNGTGTLATIPNNRFVNHRWLYFASVNRCVLQFGSTIYNTIAEAENNRLAEAFQNVGLAVDDNTRTIMSLAQGATDLSDLSDARFNNTGKFGFGTGGGGSVTGGIGDVTSNTASVTSTAIVTFADTSGKLVGESGVLIDGSNNVTGAASYNGVALTTGGSATNFLNEQGNYVAVAGGSGDVVGPVSSVDNSIALFNGVTGKLIKEIVGGATNSGVVGFAEIGSTAASEAFFGRDGQSAANFAIKQSAAGMTTINTKSNQFMNFTFSGSVSNGAQWRSDLGFTMVGATGGTQGAGTMNLKGSFVNGVAVSTTQVVVKSSDQSVLNTATPQDDDTLLFAMDANSTYTFKVVGFISHNYAGNKQYFTKSTIPAGATLEGYLMTQDGDIGTSFDYRGGSTFSLTTTLGGATVLTSRTAPIIIEGTITTSATAGNYQFQFSSVSADVGEGFTMEANSFIEFTKVN